MSIWYCSSAVILSLQWDLQVANVLAALSWFISDAWWIFRTDNEEPQWLFSMAFVENSKLFFQFSVWGGWYKRSFWPKIPCCWQRKRTKIEGYCRVVGEPFRIKWKSDVSSGIQTNVSMGEFSKSLLICLTAFAKRVKSDTWWPLCLQVRECRNGGP